MNRVGLEISRFNPADASQTRIAENCRQDYRDVLRARLSVLETKNARRLGALLPDLSVLADDNFRELRSCGAAQPIGDFHRSLRGFA